LSIVSLIPLQGCVEIVPSPFVSDAGTDVESEAMDTDGDTVDAPQSDAPPSVGTPCLDDKQCDDFIACTFDTCDLSIQRCRHEPNHLSCQDGRYCNGSERCDPSIGCVAGEPITCSDLDPCTIDQCVEQTQSCDHVVRDADGDGDPDWHCGGGDCNDNDPLINSLVLEVCANGRDDDCDGEVDESDCIFPSNDTCADPLTLPFDQTIVAPLFGTKADYAASCIPSSGLRDIVAAVDVPDDATYDLDVWVRADQGNVFTAISSICGDPAEELSCGSSAFGPMGPVARFLARKVPAGLLPVYFASDVEQNLLVHASLLPTQPPTTNETCGTAIEVTPGQPTIATLIGVETDVGSHCSASTGDLLYRFTTTDAHDIRVTAGSIDGFGEPVLSLRNENCAKPEDEIACASAAAPLLFARNQPAGTYYVAVSATAASIIQFVVELQAPSEPPPGDDCQTAPKMTANVTESISLYDHADNVKDSCLANAKDAARTLTLTQPSDVLLVGQYSSSDTGAVSLWYPPCASEDLIGCANAAPSPVRIAASNLAAGEYRAVIETRHGNPAQLTAFVRPATAPTFIAFADTCEEAYPIPLQGGLFQGNTSNATAQYAAGCDQAGGAAAGASDQMLRLDLPGPRRVVFDMRGSSYRTLLNIRKGPACPGTEVLHGCSVGFYQQRSYLDLRLEKGTYYVQVDGFFGESGAWFLDVFIVE